MTGTQFRSNADLFNDIDQKATSARTAHEQEIQGNGALVGDSSKWFSQLVLQAHDIRDYVGAFVGLEDKVRHKNVVLP